VNVFWDTVYIRLLTAVLRKSILLHITNMTWLTTWRRVPILGEWVTTDSILMTSLYLIFMYRAQGGSSR